MTRKPSIPERLRRQVRERAHGQCEYCLIHESDMYYPHEADHVIAEKHGGAASLENLAWACFTSSGRATVALLHLNDAERVAYRLGLIDIGHYPAQ
jgi:5-methylcytosine-specific restriction endonuclease McrA